MKEGSLREFIKTEREKKTWGRMALVILAAVILEATSFMQLRFLNQSTRREAEIKTDNVLSTARYEIMDVVDQAEQAVRDNMWITQWCLDNPDSLINVTRRIVEDNPVVVGSTVALVPGYNKKLPFYAPYSYLRDGELHQTSLATEKYNYPTHEWFIEPLEVGMGYWSEPYLDTNGGNIKMTTYSSPVLDPQGVTGAVITADVSLEWLSKHVGRLDIYPKAFSVLVSRKGTVMIGPVDSLAMKMSVQDMARQIKDEEGMSELIEGMLAGKRGVVSIHTRERGTNFVHYAPIPRTGWSMAVVIPESEIYKDVRRVSVVCLALQVLGLFMLIIILLSVAKGWMDYQKARDEEDKLESELQIGRDIQMSMIPKVFPPFPERNDIDIAATIVPAKMVGGDLYDFYMRDEKLFFCIGDVSGKGVPASLLMAVTRSLFRNISAQEESPAKIVEGINKSMDTMDENGMFVTFFCGVLYMQSGRLRYCNAGHNPPLIFTDHIHELEVLPNLPLGVESSMVFEEQEMNLLLDDALYLYTDGISEAENPKHELFGLERMIAVLGERRTAWEHMEAMKEAIADFVEDAPQSDDITMLFIHYLNDNSEPKTMARHLVLHNNIQQIPQLAEFVEAIAEEKGIDQAMAMSLNLALEEAVTNVILYAYPDGIDGLVDIEAFIEDDCLRFILSDSGKPFDPTAAPDADVTLGVNERKIGGLGIYLVRNIMDTVSYRYENGKNILTMIKKI